VPGGTRTLGWCPASARNRGVLAGKVGCRARVLPEGSAAPRRGARWGGGRSDRREAGRPSAERHRDVLAAGRSGPCPAARPARAPWLATEESPAGRARRPGRSRGRVARAATAHRALPGAPRCGSAPLRLPGSRAASTPPHGPPALETPGGALPGRRAPRDSPLPGQRSPQAGRAVGWGPERPSRGREAERRASQGRARSGSLRAPPRRTPRPSAMARHRGEPGRASSAPGTRAASPRSGPEAR